MQARRPLPASSLSRPGLCPGNIILCDNQGVIYQGRTEGMNHWKSAHAVKTDRRTLEEAMKGADVVFGLSQNARFPEEMIRSMADRPINFSPWPTRTRKSPRKKWPAFATMRSWQRVVRITRTRSNNVLGFPYIFRGALDVRARQINDAMKIAAAEALANLAREDVPTMWLPPIRRSPALRAAIHHPRSHRSAPDFFRHSGGRGESRD